MSQNKHVAVKCNYNNGDEGEFVGFNGTCSEDIIKLNTQRFVWCSQPQCECKIYYENGFRGDKPIDPCLESVLFKYWEFGAGTYHSGERQGIPKHANIRPGGIALLTTRLPEDKEADRKIIGLFKINRVRDNPDKETKIYSDNFHKLRLPLDEAKQLYLWDYYNIDSTIPRWGTGLFRYLSDDAVAQILYDLKDTVKDDRSKRVIQSLLKNDFAGSRRTEIKGLRKRDLSRAKTVAIKRKYGPGGEGIEHKKLKEYVAKNPHVIGLQNVEGYELEHVFQSGDTVDILFRVSNKIDVVVEIETTIPMPGCHQAIKYRALRCAERLIDLQSPNVRAVVVAWEIPNDAKKFCNKYKIEYFEIKPK